MRQCDIDRLIGLMGEVHRRQKLARAIREHSERVSRRRPKTVEIEIVPVSWRVRLWRWLMTRVV